MERNTNVFAKIKEELLSCQICNEPYEDPRMLPCQHVICMQCLTRHVSAREDAFSLVQHRFNCPFCRKEIKIPSSGISAIQKCVIFLNQIKDVLPGDDVKCVTCEIQEGVELYLCMDCMKYACSDCFVGHAEGIHKKELVISAIKKNLSENQQIFLQNELQTHELLRQNASSVQYILGGITNKLERCVSGHESLTETLIRTHDTHRTAIKTLSDKTSSIEYCLKRATETLQTLQTEVEVFISEQTTAMETVSRNHDEVQATVNNVLKKSVAVEVAQKSTRDRQMELKSMMEKFISQRAALDEIFRKTHTEQQGSLKKIHQKFSSMEEIQKTALHVFKIGIENLERKITSSIESSSNSEVQKMVLEILQDKDKSSSDMAEVKSACISMKTLFEEVKSQQRALDKKMQQVELKLTTLFFENTKNQLKSPTENRDVDENINDSLNNVYHELRSLKSELGVQQKNTEGWISKLNKKIDNKKLDIQTSGGHLNVSGQNNDIISNIWSAKESICFDLESIENDMRKQQESLNESCESWNEENRDLSRKVQSVETFSKNLSEKMAAIEKKLMNPTQVEDRKQLYFLCFVMIFINTVTSAILLTFYNKS